MSFGRAYHLACQLQSKKIIIQICSCNIKRSPTAHDPLVWHLDSCRQSVAAAHSGKFMLIMHVEVQHVPSPGFSGLQSVIWCYCQWKLVYGPALIDGLDVAILCASTWINITTRITAGWSGWKNETSNAEIILQTSAVALLSSLNKIVATICRVWRYKTATFIGNHSCNAMMYKSKERRINAMITFASMQVKTSCCWVPARC